MLTEHDMTLVEQVTDRLLSEQGVVIVDMAKTVGAPTLMVLVPDHMPCFLYIQNGERTNLVERKAWDDFQERIADVKCTGFEVSELRGVDYLLEAIWHIRKRGMFKEPRTAASEGFEQQYSDEGRHAVARSQLPGWME